MSIFENISQEEKIQKVKETSRKYIIELNSGPMKHTLEKRKKLEAKLNKKKK